MEPWKSGDEDFRRKAVREFNQAVTIVFSTRGKAMATNELGQQVPEDVEALASTAGCLEGVKYVYQNGRYGQSYPRASIGCARPTRFRSMNFERYLVTLKDDWVAFRSPSTPATIPPPPGPRPEEPIPPSDDEDEPDWVTDATMAGILRLTDPKAYFPADDPWVRETHKLIDQSINQLVTEFVADPYLHRVEHSLHAHLFRFLSAHEHLAGKYPLGSGPNTTQLIHKEWPETIPRSGSRRGNFDLAVLSPTVISGCRHLDEFREGRLPAPFVIEMGLDYDCGHLANDVSKLLNSRPYQGYLIHFDRKYPRDPHVEQIIRYLKPRTGLNTAYAWIGSGQKAYKLVGDADITTI
jgi:hypothetical protein